MAWFKVKYGRHSTGSIKEGTRKICKPGDTFESKSAKETAFLDRDKEKFERIVTYTDVQPKEESEPEVVEVDISKLDTMTVNELKAFAKEYDIDLRGATTKHDILEVIKSNVK